MKGSAADGNEHVKIFKGSDGNEHVKIFIPGCSCTHLFLTKACWF
jgi:hypothetical protein